MPDVPGVPSAEELAALPHAELAVRLAEAYRLIAQLTARVDQLERQVRRDCVFSELQGQRCSSGGCPATAADCHHVRKVQFGWSVTV